MLHLRSQLRASVLATITIALANRAGAEPGSLLRHLRKVHGHDHGRHTDGPAHGQHGAVLRPDREREPFLPRHGADVVVGVDIERRGDGGGEHAESLRGRSHVDRLPVPVEHEDGGLGQDVAHKSLKR